MFSNIFKTHKFIIILTHHNQEIFFNPLKNLNQKFLVVKKFFSSLLNYLYMK